MSESFDMTPWRQSSPPVITDPVSGVTYGEFKPPSANKVCYVSSFSVSYPGLPAGATLPYAGVAGQGPAVQVSLVPTGIPFSQGGAAKLAVFGSRDCGLSAYAVFDFSRPKLMPIGTVLHALIAMPSPSPTTPVAEFRIEYWQPIT